MLARMADAPEPPPRTFTFKPKEFERVNAPRPEADEPREAAPLANDVFAMQRDVREREIAAGMDVLKPADRPHSKRRRRDYWVMLIAGNAGFLAVGALVGANPVTIIYTFSGIVLYTVGLTWVMWFVVDRY